MKKIASAIRKFFAKKEKSDGWPKNMVLHQYWDDDGNECREWISIA